MSGVQLRWIGLGIGSIQARLLYAGKLEADLNKIHLSLTQILNSLPECKSVRWVDTGWVAYLNFSVWFAFRRWCCWIFVVVYIGSYIHMLVERPDARS